MPNLTNVSRCQSFKTKTTKSTAYDTVADSSSFKTLISVKHTPRRVGSFSEQCGVSLKLDSNELDLAPFLNLPTDEVTFSYVSSDSIDQNTVSFPTSLNQSILNELFRRKISDASFLSSSTVSQFSDNDTNCFTYLDEIFGDVNQSCFSKSKKKSESFSNMVTSTSKALEDSSRSSTVTPPSFYSSISKPVCEEGLFSEKPLSTIINVKDDDGTAKDYLQSGSTNLKDTTTTTLGLTTGHFAEIQQAMFDIGTVSQLSHSSSVDGRSMFQTLTPNYIASELSENDWEFSKFGGNDESEGELDYESDPLVCPTQYCSNESMFYRLQNIEMALFSYFIRKCSAMTSNEMSQVVFIKHHLNELWRAAITANVQQVKQDVSDSVDQLVKLLRSKCCRPLPADIPVAMYASTKLSVPKKYRWLANYLPTVYRDNLGTVLKGRLKFHGSENSSCFYLNQAESRHQLSEIVNRRDTFNDALRRYKHALFPDKTITKKFQLKKLPRNPENGC